MVNLGDCVRQQIGGRGLSPFYLLASVAPVVPWIRKGRRDDEEEEVKQGIGDSLGHHSFSTLSLLLSHTIQGLRGAEAGIGAGE